MVTSVKVDERVNDVAFDDDSISVSLMDGRVISVPLVWFPRLLRATREEREAWKVCGGGYGLHWEAIQGYFILKRRCNVSRPYLQYRSA